MNFYKWIRLILITLIATAASMAIGCGEKDQKQALVRHRQSNGDKAGNKSETTGPIQTKAAADDSNKQEELVEKDEVIRRDIEKQRQRVFPEISQGRVPFSPGRYQLYTVTAFTTDGETRKTVLSFDEERVVKSESGRFVLAHQQDGMVTQSYHLNQDLVFPILAPTTMQVELKDNQSFVVENRPNNNANSEAFLNFAMKVTKDKQADLTDELSEATIKESRDLMLIINEGPSREGAQLTPLSPLDEGNKELIRFSYEEQHDTAFRTVVLTYEKLDSPEVSPEIEEDAEAGAEDLETQDQNEQDDDQAPELEAVDL